MRNLDMELKLARTEIDKKPKSIKLNKIEEEISKTDSIIYYFDRDNSHKDLLTLQDHIEAMGKSFYMREVKYGLSDNEYMYEVHIIS